MSRALCGNSSGLDELACAGECPLDLLESRALLDQLGLFLGGIHLDDEVALRMSWPSSKWMLSTRSVTVEEIDTALGGSERPEGLDSVEQGAGGDLGDDDRRAAWRGDAGRGLGRAWW